MTTRTTGDPGARKRFRFVPELLHEINFRRYWSAQSISYVGDQVTMVALPLIGVLVLDVSPGEMGVLMAASMLPNLVLSVHAGAFVDRRGHRRQTMVVADVVRAVLLLSVPLAWFAGSLTFLHLSVVAFLTGAMGVLFNVAAQAVFTSLVPRERFVEASSLKQASFSFSWVAGPGLGGLLVQAVSAPVALLVDTVSFLGSALLLRGVSADEPPGTPPTRGHVREGLSFVFGTSVLRAKFVAGTSLNFFYTVYFTMLFLFAAQELGLSPGMIGLALSVGAIGALIGSVLAGRVIRRIGIGLAFVVGSLVYPAALVLVPFAQGPDWVAFTLLVTAEFVSGAGLMLSDISGNSLQQAITPDRLRARVHGAYMTISYGARPVGALVAGGLGAWLGLRTTLLIGVVGGVLSIVPLLRPHIVGMRELPDEA